MKPTKKVLIISYYWPPAGGPGVQRWLKFVKYLPDFNIEPHVYIPENPTYPLIDEKLMSEVSDKAIIIKQPIFEPYGLASVFSKNKTKKILTQQKQIVHLKTIRFKISVVCQFTFKLVSLSEVP